MGQRLWLYIDAFLFFAGFALRLFDMILDVLYLLTETFDNETYYYLCIFFVISSPLVIILAFIVISLIYLCRKDYIGALKKLGLGFVVALLDPPGILQLVFCIVILKTKAKQEDRDYLDMTSKITGVVEGILESLPSMIIQTFNNIENDSWSLIAILSVVASLSGLIYTILKLVSLCDKYAKMAQWVEDVLPHDNDGSFGIEVAQVN